MHANMQMWTFTHAHIAQALINMFIHLSRSGLFLPLKVILMIRPTLITQTPTEKQIIMDY